MRSRFSAFALGRADHIAASWDATTRPADVQIDPDVHWRRLQIVDTAQGGEHDDTGVVEFRATHLKAGEPFVMHERSRFRRMGGRWYYLDSTHNTITPLRLG